MPPSTTDRPPPSERLRTFVYNGLQHCCDFVLFYIDMAIHILTMVGIAVVVAQILPMGSVDRHEACLRAILCPDSYDKPPCTRVQGQFCENPSVNPAQALIKDNIRAETIDGGYRFDFDPDVEPQPTSTSNFVVQTDHLSLFPGSSFNINVSPINVSPVLLSRIFLLRQFAPSYRHPALHPTNKLQSFPTLRSLLPFYPSTIILPKSSLPAANMTRFQVPVEAAFNCSSSEKLSLGVVVRIAETEKAKELERGDRIQLEEKKGLTKIAGAEKGSW
ncbi:hypothetical protein B9479_007669 [Cryptococcus floricola]|uniref:Uncharacterized protein n=1 Tax=Cryptococcus floricola TaxID=2591691 RepID=A0A5D3ANT3_9TREE|nr:hypothetical protein B9479_007669 [Cryptococcus floricola]